MTILKKQSGFTLIEVMAATTILLIGILAVSGILLRGYKAMGTAEGRNTALHMTQQEIEAAIQNEETDDETIVERQENYVMRFDNFGIEIEGTLLSVKKIAPGLPEGEVIYVTFIPYDWEDPDGS